MKKIILTGGGTAGHVTPNIALIPYLKEAGFEVSYIGSYEGMEKSLIEKTGIPYTGISSGKLRRYIDLKNLSDPFRVIKGFAETKKVLKKEQPNIVFSKGGFVTVPVVLAAKSLHIPIIIHESDMTPGLANKIAIPSATKVCCNFPETVNYLPEGKAVLSGSPIRKELASGSKEKALEICGFNTEKPIIMMTGGSLGSVHINSVLRSVLPELLKKYQLIHLCGKGNADESLNNTEGYFQLEYASSEMPHLLAAAEMVISRAGANSICELLSLNKPNVLIPLSAEQSRGDQILNAASFEKQGFSVVIQDNDLTEENLMNAINEVYENREAYISKMKQASSSDACRIITDLIVETAL